MKNSFFDELVEGIKFYKKDVKDVIALGINNEFMENGKGGLYSTSIYWHHLELALTDPCFYKRMIKSDTSFLILAEKWKIYSHWENEKLIFNITEYEVTVEDQTTEIIKNLTPTGINILQEKLIILEKNKYKCKKEGCEGNLMKEGKIKFKCGARYNDLELEYIYDTFYCLDCGHVYYLSGGKMRDEDKLTSR